MKILVLGGTQFVGHHLVHRLAGEGHDVVVLNRGQSPADLPEGVERLIADRTDGAALAASLGDRPFDVVYDMLLKDETDAQTALSAFRGKTARYVGVSSSSVYGRFTKAEPVTEEQPLDPAKLKGAPQSKLLAENLLRAAAEAEGFPAVLVRPGTVYGPRDNTPAKRPGAKGAYFFTRLVQGKPLIVPGFLECMQCYIHVDDLTRMLSLAGEKEVAPGSVFNAAGEPHTFGDYVKAHLPASGLEGPVAECRKDLGSLMKWRHGRALEMYHSSFGHFLLSIEKAKRELGFAPEVPLEEGLRRTWTWLAEHGRELLDTPPPYIGVEDMIWYELNR